MQRLGTLCLLRNSEDAVKWTDLDASHCSECRKRVVHNFFIRLINNDKRLTGRLRSLLRCSTTKKNKCWLEFSNIFKCAVKTGGDTVYQIITFEQKSYRAQFEGYSRLHRLSTYKCTKPQTTGIRSCCHSPYFVELRTMSFLALVKLDRSN